MPKSKSKRRRYRPPPRKKPKPSPRWYGPTILGLIGAGALIIILNYMGLIPGGTKNFWLFVGLGGIAVGMLGLTQLR